MRAAERPRIVIFGAGNIGRSFIAPVFTRGGYEAVFADVAPAVLQSLESRNSYELVEKADEGDTVHRVGPVRGVDARDAGAVARELEGADICATCVGAGALPVVLKLIAGAVTRRERPLDIILAENLKGAAELARASFVEAGISAEDLGRRIGIVETSIGKMVPIMPAEEAAADPLLCWAEPYNTLIVDRDGFTGEVPDIPDFVAVSPIAPWVARKLYIHNFGHAAAAYLGYRARPEAGYIWEVLEDKEVADAVESAMSVSGEALRREYPEVFSAAEIKDHVADLIARFRNRALGDTVYRVGRDLARKLQRRDRVVGAIDLVRKHGLNTEAPLEVFRAALKFTARNPDGAIDVGDAAVIAAAKPDAREVPEFLNTIVGIDESGEPELRRLLAEALVKNI
jgi:mannitol-1-phosphate 5-dehydrogenase